MATSFRNPNVEVYRCCLMFGICLLHAVGFSGHYRPCITNPLVACVDGFVLISGYFGIRFTWKRFFRIWGFALACSLIVTLTYDHWLGTGIPRGVAFLSTLQKRLFGHWFLNCYAVLMLLAPALNLLVEKIEDKKAMKAVLLPLAFLAFVWCWGGMYLKRVGIQLPSPIGFGSYTYLMMAVVYLIGRFCRRYDDVFMSRSTWRLSVLGGICLFLCVVGFAGYMSPFSMGLAVFAFVIFRKIDWPYWVAGSAIWLAPSMFAVYLFHSETEGRVVVKHLMDVFCSRYGVSVFVSQLMVAVVLYFGCILLDVVCRRSLKCLVLLTWRKIHACICD